MRRWPGAEAVGGHAYSRDGLNWNYADQPPYYFEVAVGTGDNSGSNVTFNLHRRERPHLM